MRPKLILLILVIIEVFLLLIFFSPSVALSMSRIVAESEYRQNPSPTTERAAREVVAWDRRRPLIVASLASLNIIVIIWYARRIKRPAA